MFRFVLIAVFLVLEINCVPRDDFSNNNIRTANPQLSPSTISQVQSIINDADYWDNDDFVPYKNDRHDAFDWRLLKTLLLQDTNSNIVASPFSVKLALAILYEAAGSETPTQRELSTVFPNLRSPVLVREFYKSVLGSLRVQSPHYDLNVGTKMFVDEFIEPRQRYAAIIYTHYDAELQRLNFADPVTSAQIINSWCSNITAGHLKSVTTPDEVSRAVMLIYSAIYFDGVWKRPFAENQTVELPFFVQPSVQVKAQFMKQTDYFYYFESTKLNAKVLRLPYKGKKFSMTILLPNAKGGLEELIREIEGDGLKRLQWLMDETQVMVTIPKFRFEYTSQLKDVLKNIGMNEIFSASASLPGLARGQGLNDQLRVSNIIQKSGLIVHEKGSTAFAATEVALVNKFGGNNVEEFNANRPFVFFIEDESTGTLLFAGKVMDPTK